MKPSLKRLSTVCFSLILGGALALQNCPADEVITATTGGLVLNLTNVTFGYSFTVGSQDLSVDSLGIWDPSSGVGLNFSHDVGLWNSNQTLLASVNVPSGNSATLSASGFWYETITAGPVTLNAGDTYWLGAQYNIDDTDNLLLISTATTSSDITLGSAYNSFSFTLAFPGNPDAFANDGYFGPNANFTPVETPEPATCALMSLGFLALIRSRRNRR